ncbi:MAG: MoaD/ThiS family protein [Desulfovibrio sp.]|jgi:molybdopterin converting factor small subunit|nr:MoaD/ThiS family protein [Desulfovibrio sp.]
MSVTILIPTALRVFTGGKNEISVEGGTVGEAAAAFVAAYPDIRPHLYDESGALRSFVNVYVGETNIKNAKGLETALADGDTVTLVPAIAGGVRGGK